MKRAKGLVLVVDDNEATRLLVQDTLEEDGYEIVTAENGEQALRLAHQYHPDVLVLDVMMPGINGYEVCRRIRQDRHLADTRVIMLTARAFADDRLLGLQEAGADDYLTKPFSSEELVVRINKHWERKREKEALEQTISKTGPIAEIGILTAGVVHEFNNLLGGWQNIRLVQPALDSIWAGLTSEQQERFAGDFQEIRDACDGVHEAMQTAEIICRHLMSLSQGATGHGRRVQALNFVFETPLGIFYRMFRSLGVELNVDIAEEPLMVSCNLAEMMRAVIILINHAVEAMEKSRQKFLGIRLWRGEKMAHFSVTDTGCGMTPELVANIFEQHSASRSKTVGELGLAAVREIVAGHGGRIAVNSEPGRGTSVTVSLPLRVS